MTQVLIEIYFQVRTFLHFGFYLYDCYGLYLKPLNNKQHSLFIRMNVSDTTPVAEEPRFLMSLRNVSTLEGKSIKLICRVRGTPLPKIIW